MVASLNAFLCYLVYERCILLMASTNCSQSNRPITLPITCYIVGLLHRMKVRHYGWRMIHRQTGDTSGIS